MIYGYARVSTMRQAKEGNSLEYQINALERAGARKIYYDIKTGKNLMRSNFAILLNELKPGDTLLITKLDRFTRSINQANEVLTSLIDQDITVEILSIGKLNNTPTGKLIRNIFLSFAEFERDIIRERMFEGKAIARQDPNYRDGRPKKYTEFQIAHAMDLLKTNSYAQVERLTGISKSTLARARRKLKKSGD